MNADTVTATIEAPPLSARFALRILQLGAISVVLAVTTLNAFDLDRFFVPKELVLHVTALAAGLLAMRGIAKSSSGLIDRLLLGWLGVSAVSALFATNPWLALRALTLSGSGVLLFWIGRRLRDAGLARPLLGALALAVIVAAFTSLLQTYGVDSDFFSANRVPGGTLGNRNFVAHAAAFGLPVILLAALRAERRGRYARWALGSAIVVASLVLTRSRAAWLAFAAVVAVFCLAMLVSGALRRDGPTWRRLAGIAVLSFIGVAIAMAAPNSLHWRSDNPYLESVKGVADYQSGSGHGRMIQYRQSLRLALSNPLLGVGPGNWPVEYPARVPRNDPSLDDTNPGMTSNPWPSSDWVACVAERGFAALGLMALAFVALTHEGMRQLTAAKTTDEALLATALLGTLAGAAVTGLFDAVLLLAMPALLVWTALGALRAGDEPRPGQAASPRRWSVILLIVALSAAGTLRSAAQLTAMQIYAQHSDPASLDRAASIDPGNFRLQLRLARSGNRTQRCAHARVACELFPSAEAARGATRGCGK